MTTAARQALSTSETKRPVLPALGVMSDAFRDGYNIAQCEECDTVGWNIKFAPREATIVQFVTEMVAIFSEDAKHEDGMNEEGLRWLSGLFTGWLRREQ